MPAAKHERVAAVLRAKIENGELDEDDKLPSEADLTTEFDVSRTTVRQALAGLVNEGLLRSEPGVGTFVRSRRRHVYRPQDDLGETVANPQADHFIRTEAEHDPSQTIDVGPVTCPSVIATRLGVEPGTVVASRRRVRRFAGVPYSINDSYYPRDVVQGTQIEEPLDIARGVNTVLVERGFEQVAARDEIYIQMPSKDEAERLAILPGTAVAVHLVTGFTAEGRVVRVVRNVLPGDRHVITFDRVKAGTGLDAG